MIVIFTCIVHIAPACVCVCACLAISTVFWIGIPASDQLESTMISRGILSMHRQKTRLFGRFHVALPDAVCPRIAAVDKSQCNRQHRAYMTLWTLELNINLKEVDIKRKPTALLNRQVKHFRPTAHHDAGVEIVHKICHNSCRPQHLAAHTQKSLF